MYRNDWTRLSSLIFVLRSVEGFQTITSLSEFIHKKKSSWQSTIIFSEFVIFTLSFQCKKPLRIIKLNDIIVSQYGGAVADPDLKKAWAGMRKTCYNINPFMGVTKVLYFTYLQKNKHPCFQLHGGNLIILNTILVLVFIVSNIFPIEKVIIFFFPTLLQKNISDGM